MATPQAAPENEPTHPVVQEIVDELVVEEGRAVLPAARFDVWADALPRRFPRTEHPALYGQLVALALSFAPRRWPAAAQLYALSSL